MPEVNPLAQPFPSETKRPPMDFDTAKALALARLDKHKFSAKLSAGIALVHLFSSAAGRILVQLVLVSVRRRLLS